MILIACASVVVSGTLVPAAAKRTSPGAPPLPSTTITTTSWSQCSLGRSSQHLKDPALALWSGRGVVTPQSNYTSAPPLRHFAAPCATEPSLEAAKSNNAAVHACAGPEDQGASMQRPRPQQICTSLSFRGCIAAAQDLRAQELRASMPLASAGVCVRRDVVGGGRARGDRESSPHRGALMLQHLGNFGVWITLSSIHGYPYG